MKSKETTVCLDKSRRRSSEYQKFEEDKQSLAKRIYELQSDLSREKSKNEKLIEELEELQRKNQQLKEQIEKMKNCDNCKNLFECTNRRNKEKTSNKMTMIRFPCCWRLAE